MKVCSRCENPERWREYQRRYAKKHGDAVNAKTQRYRARKMGAAGSHDGGDVEAIRHRQLGLCAYCGTPIPAGRGHVDHVVPLSRGGGNGPDNLALSCSHCNQSKGAKTPEEFFRDGFPAAAIC